MTLKNCLEIGFDCGMETVGESIYNIDLHASNIFDYNTMNQEVLQVYREAADLFNNTAFTKNSLTVTVLDWINMEDDNVNEEELNI